MNNLSRIQTTPLYHLVHSFVSELFAIAHSKFQYFNFDHCSMQKIPIRINYKRYLAKNIWSNRSTKFSKMPRSLIASKEQNLRTDVFVSSNGSKHLGKFLIYWKHKTVILH